MLTRCAQRSGLNIVTNTGAWDGLDKQGKYVPEAIRDKDIDEIAEVWCSEFFDGIEGTSVRPGFVKIALGDGGKITELQERLLRAAARTANKTKLLLQCHSFRSAPAVQAAGIVEEENLPLDRFVWLHADGQKDLNAISGLARKGAWVEFDTLAEAKDLGPHVGLLRWALEQGLENRLLISQDAGAFYYGQKNDETTILPYDRIFEAFIPLCREQGIPQDLFTKLLIENAAKALDTE